MHLGILRRRYPSERITHDVFAFSVLRDKYACDSGRCSRLISWTTAPHRLFFGRAHPRCGVFRCQILEGRNRFAVTHPGVLMFLVSDWSILISFDWV